MLDAKTLRVRRHSFPPPSPLLLADSPLALPCLALQPLIRILHAHDFPPTALRFNPSSSLLVSASADNTLRVITIPDMPTSRGAIDLLTESKAGVYLTLLTALIMVLLAFWAQKHFT